MRYRPEHKAEVHEKIVKDASRRIRAEGLTGAAVAEVMRDNGLTHGGFYKHFDSKDELLLEALGAGFGEIVGRMERVVKGVRKGSEWKAIVKAYLSLEHLDHVESGCPLTALGPDLARTQKTMKPRIVAELVKYKDRMVPNMPGRTTADKERAFFAIFSTMIGALDIERLLPEARMREQVLKTARDFLLRSF